MQEQSPKTFIFDIDPYTSLPSWTTIDKKPKVDYWEGLRRFGIDPAKNVYYPSECDCRFMEGMLDNITTVIMHMNDVHKYSWKQFGLWFKSLGY